MDRTLASTIQTTSGLRSARLPPPARPTPPHHPDAAVTSVFTAASCLSASALILFVPFLYLHSARFPCCFSPFFLSVVAVVFCAGRSEVLLPSCRSWKIIIVTQISARSPRDWMICIVVGSVCTMHRETVFYIAQRADGLGKVG